MKPNPYSEYLNPAFVTAELAHAGVEVSAEQAAALVEHAVRVLETNKVMNLTRIVEPNQVVELHIVDSLAFLAHVGPIASPVVDIGSGAGFPGIPLAILGYDVALCESVSKKAKFLEDTAVALGLSTDVYALRAEELAKTRVASMGTVVARAVSALGALVELAAPLLATGGRLIALKGTPTEEEREAASKTAELCGMVQRDVAEYRLPGGESRTVFVFERTGNPRVVLPRRPGMAQRQPLVGS